MDDTGHTEYLYLTINLEGMVWLDVFRKVSNY